MQTTKTKERKSTRAELARVRLLARGARQRCGGDVSADGIIRGYGLEVVPLATRTGEPPGIDSALGPCTRAGSGEPVLVLMMAPGLERERRDRAVRRSLALYELYEAELDPSLHRQWDRLDAFLEELGA